MIDLIQFLMLNYGVLVTPDAAGAFCCQMCGGMAITADRITHDSAKPCKILNSETAR